VGDDSFLVMTSAEREPLDFTVPGSKYGERWAVVVDTAADGPPDAASRPEVRAGQRVRLSGNSMVVLRRSRPRPRSAPG
jgi:glycogen operon protein